MRPEVGLAGLMLDFPHSGSATYARQLAAHLPQVAPDLGYRLFVRNAVDLPRELPHERLASPFAAWWNRPGTGARADKLAWEAVMLPLAAASRREQLLHSLYFAAPIVKPVPVIVTIHDLIPLVLPGYHRGAASRLYAALMARAVVGCAAIITVSEHARGEISRVLHYPDERIHVTLEAADTRFHPDASHDDRELLAARYSLPDRFLLYLGGAERRKNVELLVRAWHAVRHRMNTERIKLVIVARFPPPDSLYPDIPGLVRALGLDESVCLVPAIDEADKPALYRMALAFCFPSRYEGFGLPPLEAMASGVPVLCSSATSLPEVVGDAALLLDPSDTAAWSEAMMRVVDSEALRCRLRARSLERAAGFSWERTARETAAIHRDVLAR